MEAFWKQLKINQMAKKKIETGTELEQKPHDEEENVALLRPSGLQAFTTEEILAEVERRGLPWKFSKDQSQK